MIIKTRQARVGAVIAVVKERHTYTNPALMVLPVIGGSADYLRWLAEQSAPEVE
jgi:periplasmic divalent cation tolerance protein